VAIRVHVECTPYKVRIPVQGKIRSDQPSLPTASFMTLPGNREDVILASIVATILGVWLIKGCSNC